MGHSLAFLLRVAVLIRYRALTEPLTNDKESQSKTQLNVASISLNINLTHYMKASVWRCCGPFRLYEIYPRCMGAVAEEPIPRPGALFWLPNSCVQLDWASDSHSRLQHTHSNCCRFAVDRRQLPTHLQEPRYRSRFVCAATEEQTQEGTPNWISTY